MAIYDDMSSQAMLDQLLGNDRTTGETFTPPVGSAQADLQSLINASGLPATHPLVLAAQKAGYGNPVGMSDVMAVTDGTIPGGATGTFFPPPGTRACPPGMVYDPELRECIPEAATWRDCGEGYERDPITKECVKIEQPPEKTEPCPEGYERNANGDCVKTKPQEPPPCPEGYTRNEDGVCVQMPNEKKQCPEGYQLNARGECDKMTTTPPEPCKEGYVRNAAGECVPKEPPPPPPPKDECPPGLVKDPLSGLCVPPKPPIPPPPPPPTVTCEDGFIYDPAQKKCVPIAKPPPPPTPPPGPQPCPAGYERKTPTGPCEPIDLGPCPSGYVRSTVTGKCEPITITPPTGPETPTCKEGEYYDTVLKRCMPKPTTGGPTPPTPPPTPPTPPPGSIRPLPTLTGSAYFGPSIGAAAQTPTVITPTAPTTPAGPSTAAPTPTSIPVPNAPNITFTPGQPQFFGPSTGILPGTMSSSYNPLSAYRGPLPTDLLRQNPNLSPTILGGQERLGYYVDRLGNKIYSPGGNFGFAEGGEVDSEEAPDPASAQAALRKLLEAAPAQTQTEVQMSPNARSVKRTSAKSVDQGNMKGMSMKMEEAKVASGESARDQLAALGEEYKQRLREMDNEAKGLLRNTLARGTFDRPGLAGRGPLTKRRFSDGGEAESSKGMMERMFNALPLQVKTYAESVSKEDKRRAPITEKSLSAQELDKLRELISIAESNPVLSEKTGRPLPGVVDYAHHREQIRRHNPNTGMPLAMLDTDFNVGESGNLRNTLGAFRFERLPDGSYVVKDQYDYTGDAGEKMNPLVKYANRVGVNRPVQIMLPPVKGKK